MVLYGWIYIVKNRVVVLGFGFVIYTQITQVEVISIEYKRDGTVVGCMDVGESIQDCV